MTVDDDPNGWATAGAGNGYITVPVAGHYLITACMTFYFPGSSGAIGNIYANVAKNSISNNILGGYSSINPGSTSLAGYYQIFMSNIVLLAAGDKIYLCATVPGTVDTIIGNSYATYLNVQLIGATS